jgi:hypothetical protein
MDSLMRIGAQGTTPYGLGRPKEGHAMTRLTIQKIAEDHGMLPMMQIIISIKIYVK